MLKNFVFKGKTLLQWINEGAVDYADEQIKHGEGIMKLRYIGESFGVDRLTDGKIYEAPEEHADFYRVIDDSGEDYLYTKENPAPLDESSPGGRWEIVEE